MFIAKSCNDTFFCIIVSVLVFFFSEIQVRVYDVPSARLIDWFAFARAVTSLAFSPASDFLATTHVNQV